MQETRRQLVEAIARLDSQEEDEKFREKLLVYEKLDVKKWLEMKILETEEGYWKQVPLKMSIGEFEQINSRYPLRIPALVSQPLTQFRKVQYFLCDREMAALPSKATIMLSHHDPCRSCTVLVDGKIKYQYVFASERARRTSEIEELYPILYAMACREFL